MRSIQRWKYGNGTRCNSGSGGIRYADYSSDCRGATETFSTSSNGTNDGSGCKRSESRCCSSSGSWSYIWNGTESAGTWIYFCYVRCIHSSIWRKYCKYKKSSRAGKTIWSNCRSGAWSGWWKWRWKLWPWNPLYRPGWCKGICQRDRNWRISSCNWECAWKLSGSSNTGIWCAWKDSWKCRYSVGTAWRERNYRQRFPESNFTWNQKSKYCDSKF